VGQSVAHVAEAEVDVARLVVARAARQLRRGLVGRMVFDEAQQVEERPLPQHRKQEGGLGEVLELEERQQRARRRDRRDAEVPARHTGALQEDVDVASLVGELRRQEHRHLGVGRMDPRQEARRHVERRQLVLGEERHDLPHRPFEGLGQRAHLLPGDVASGVPLRRHGLVVEGTDLGRCDVIALEERKGIRGTAGLDAGAAGCEAGLGSRALGQRVRREDVRCEQTPVAQRQGRRALVRRRARSVRTAAHEMTIAPFGRLVAAEILVAFDPAPGGQVFPGRRGRREDRDDSPRLEKRQGRPYDRQQAAAQRQIAAVDRDDRGGGGPLHHSSCQSRAASRLA
jgi:hypothetical protein